MVGMIANLHLSLGMLAGVERAVGALEQEMPLARLAEMATHFTSFSFNDLERW